MFDKVINGNYTFVSWLPRPKYSYRNYINYNTVYSISQIKFKLALTS